MFIYVICHFTQVMWPIELVFKLTSSLQEGVGVSQIIKKLFTLFFNKIRPVPSFVFSENTACQFVVLVVCACIQNTIHLSIVPVLTFQVSKPIKFSPHFTNNIVLELTKHPAFEVRKKNVDPVFIYCEVFSRQ